MHNADISLVVSRVHDYTQYLPPRRSSVRFYYVTRTELSEFGTVSHIKQS